MTWSSNAPKIIFSFLALIFRLELLRSFDKDEQTTDKLPNQAMAPKFITVNGVRKLNPEWKNSSSTEAYPFRNRTTALPVVSHPSQAGLFSPAEAEIVVAPSYAQAVKQYQDYMAENDIIIVEAEIVVEDQDNQQQQHGLGKIAGVLSKYEIPAGMLTKLLELKNFDVAEIIVDDSSSMNALTDARGPRGEQITRWTEAKWRILQMMEIIAYVKAPTFYIHFLNRPAVIEMERRAGESPEAFFVRASTMVENEFSLHPNGLTPALERIKESLSRHQDKSCLRYFMGDGVPNGGDFSCREIHKLLTNRARPERNPFTFMSCTDNDEATEWMKECEEIAPYCSELDDYEDESREVLKDQGKAFPYSYGLHLVAQIVAAFNPHDLDAMDESVPFTKKTLEDVLGYQTSQQEYKYYFDSFLEAQRLLPQNVNQRNFVAKLPALFAEFCEVTRAADIPAVTEYRMREKAANQKANQIKQRQTAAPVEADCCVIL